MLCSQDVVINKIADPVVPIQAFLILSKTGCQQPHSSAIFSKHGYLEMNYQWSTPKFSKKVV